ncbi:MAG TPA: glycosyltransferase, partial [Nitrolancea sp.]|nr:glycosyltransferase [Nitrolancea sp.]
MRILMVTDFYHPFLGGVEKHVRSLSIGLVERGHHVAVVTLGRAGLPDFEIDHDVNVYRIHGTAQRLDRLFSSADRPWAPPLPDPELTRAIQRIVKQEQPDIVHGHDWLARSFLPLQLRERAPFVVSLHYHTLTCAKKSLMYREAPCSGPQFQKCVRCSAAHYGTPKGLLTLTGNWASSALERKEIDMFLPVSYATAVGNGLVGSDVPFQVIPNFVPTHADSSGDDLASYVDQLPSEGYLLFVGDLRRDKGLHVLLKAYAEMSERIPLVLIGKVWPETPETFPSNVIVFKHWPNYAVMEAWRRSTIALVPSVWPEPCATVVLEAMASGRPVIATRIGGNPEMVVDGETGVLIPPEDPAALRDAIERLLTDQALMKEMGEAGKRRVVAFQSDSVITRIEEVYASVVASKSGTTAVPWPESASVANPPTLSESATRHTPSPSIVSIIINNFNYDRFLKDAIESALNQSYEHTEVIVVDDGSTDTSREIISSYADRVVPVFKENGGQASAFNVGFAHSHGDIVIFLDSDDRLLPHIAAEVVRVFESEPRSAKVQYRLDMIDATGNP